MKRTPSRRRFLALILVFVLACIGIGVAMAADSSTPQDIHACYGKADGYLRIVSDSSQCKKSEIALDWNQAGPAGPQGEQGLLGPQGMQGIPGPQGEQGTCSCEITLAEYDALIARVAALEANQVCMNGQTGDCYTGPANTEGVGICEAGTQTCNKGAWGDCIGQILPTTETCNGLDDDCNGAIDEGDPGGGGASCSTGLSGVCAAGTIHCTNGALSCVQNVMPSAEVCNGLDDDCDGLIDEDGVCVTTCVHDTDCPAGEVCELTIGCAQPMLCVPGCHINTDCGVGQICQQQECLTCPCPGNCVATCVPTTEVCNGLDDDCDGQVDENPNTLCSIPNTQSTCQSGACVITSCNAGYANCDNNPSNGCEVNLQSDVNNCGLCASACSGNHMDTVTCTGGACSGTCAAGYADCNNNLRADGCEVNLNNDASNCGSCEHACSVDQMCNGGSCNCIQPYIQCGSICVDLMSDPNNCGSCGSACAAGQACIYGTCVCNAASCPNGCCSGNICMPYASQTSSLCGTGGSTCSMCPGGYQCISGQCSP